MALESPAVATDAGGTAELARDGQEGLIVQPANTAALDWAMLTAARTAPVATRARRSLRGAAWNRLSFETRWEDRSIYDNARRAVGSTPGCLTDAADMRELLKSALTVRAARCPVPRILVSHGCRADWRDDRAIGGARPRRCAIPGSAGSIYSLPFLRRAGIQCHSTAEICYGTILSKTGAMIEDHVYVGPRCHLGLVHIEREVLIGAGCPRAERCDSHAFDDPAIPIRRAVPRTPVLVRVGAGSWIGSAA